MISRNQKLEEIYMKIDRVAHALHQSAQSCNDIQDKNSLAVWRNIFHGIWFSKNHIMQQTVMSLQKTKIL